MFDVDDDLVHYEKFFFKKFDEMLKTSTLVAFLFRFSDTF